MKKIYFNGDTNLWYTDGTAVEADASNDDILKWGATFPESLTDTYPDAHWVLWAASNNYDFDPANPEGDGIAFPADKVNYHPYYGEPGMENPAR